MKKLRFPLLSILLILALVACTLPGSAGGDGPDLALTITAQALLLGQPGPPGSLDTATAEFTATTGPSSTPGATDTPAVPTVTVSVNTNCRAGPGLAYSLIGALTIGQNAQVVGKSSSAPNYWVINTPGGKGTCWLWAEYATVSGNTSGLQEYAIPPTPTPTVTLTPTLSAPHPVKNLAEDSKTCGITFGGNIVWDDNSDNEDGFNIYLDGTLHGTVAANVETYPIPAVIIPPGGVTLTLGVEAFNAAGKSATKEIMVTCP